MDRLPRRLLPRPPPLPLPRRQPLVPVGHALVRLPRLRPRHPPDLHLRRPLLLDLPHPVHRFPDGPHPLPQPLRRLHRGRPAHCALPGHAPRPQLPPVLRHGRRHVRLRHCLRLPRRFHPRHRRDRRRPPAPLVAWPCHRRRRPLLVSPHSCPPRPLHRHRRPRNRLDPLLDLRPLRHPPRTRRLLPPHGGRPSLVWFRPRHLGHRL